MVEKKVIGFLVLVVLTSSVYLTLPESVRLDVGKTYSTFKVFEDGNWEVSGTERTILMDGTKIMRASKRVVNFTVEGNLTKIYRYAYFKQNITLIDIYSFRGDVKDVELFPVEHKTEIINGKGKYFRYEVKDLTYSGETYKLTGENLLSFGKNMKIELNPDYRWGYVYKKGTVRVQYNINSDYEVFYNRLFDPVNSNTTLYLDEISSDRYYELGTITELKANVTNSTGSLIYNATGNNICLNIDQVGYGADFICGNGSVSYNLTTNAVKNVFNDSSTSKNLTYPTSGSNETHQENSTSHSELANYFYINYTKPSYSIGAKWQVKHGYTPLFYNITINSSNCWDADNNTLVLRILSNYSTYTSSQPQCYNGSDWIDVGNVSEVSYPSAGWDSANYSSSLYDGNWSSYATYAGGMWKRCQGSGTCHHADIYEEAIYWNIYYGPIVNKTIYVNFNRYDEIQSAYIDLEGFENTSYPLNVKIYINDTLVDSISGYLSSGNQTLDELSNGNTIENLSFTGSGVTKRYLKLPKSSNVTSAYLDLKSYIYLNWISDSYYSGLLSESQDVSIVDNFLGTGKYGGIKGLYDGTLRAYLWDNSTETWSRNTTYESGLTDEDMGYFAEVTLIYNFSNNGKWTLWVNGQGGGIKGWTWSGSTWQDDSNIVSGLLNQIYNYPSLDVFYNLTGDNNWNAIYSWYGGLVGYTWSGSSWVSNSSIISGLPSLAGDIDIGYNITSQNQWNFIGIKQAVCMGPCPPYLFGYYWNGSTWIDDTGNITRKIDASMDSVSLVYGLYLFDVWTIFKEGSSYHLEDYPRDSYIQSADSSGVHEWNWTGEFTPTNGTQTSNLNSTLINTYLASCTADLEGYCLVPLLFYSGSAGILEVSNIEINYTYTINPTRDLTATAINTYLASQSSGFHNVPIKISSETNTIIQIDNINITYFGSDNISVTAHFDGDGTYSASNDTQIVKVVSSSHNFSIPIHYGYISFQPKSTTSQDVVPVEQRDGYPALNLTALNYDALMNFSLSLNESHNCINLTVSATNNKSAGFLMNTSYQDLSTNLSLLNTVGVYMWADYSCSGLSPYIWRWWRPLINLRGCAINSVKCS